MKSWFYRNNDDRDVGPFEEEALEQLYNAGAISGDTQVRPDNGEWISFSALLTKESGPIPVQNESAAHVFGTTLMDIGRAAAKEAKRGSHLAVLKTSIEKLKAVDLPKARTELGRKSYELKLPETLRARHDEITALQIEMEKNRAGITVEQTADFKNKVIATAKNTAGKAAAEAKELKLKRLYCSLGTEAEQSPIPELKAELDQVQQIIERIRRFESEYAAHSANHEARASLKTSVKDAAKAAGGLVPSSSKFKRLLAWVGLLVCILGVGWLVKILLPMPVWIWCVASPFIFSAGFFLNLRILNQHDGAMSFIRWLKKGSMSVQVISGLVFLWFVASCVLSVVYKPAWMRGIPFQWCLDASIPENMELDHAVSSIKLDVPPAASAVDKKVVNDGVAILRSKERFWVRVRQRMEHTDSASQFTANIKFMTKGLERINVALQRWEERTVKKTLNAGQNPALVRDIIAEVEHQIQQSVSTDEMQRFQNSSTQASERFSDDPRVRDALSNFLAFMKGVQEKAGSADSLGAKLQVNSTDSDLTIPPLPPDPNDFYHTPATMKRSISAEDYAKAKGSVKYRLNGGVIEIGDDNGEVLFVGIKIKNNSIHDPTAGARFAATGQMPTFTPEQNIPFSYDLNVETGKDDEGKTVDKDPTLLPERYLIPVKKLVEWSIAAKTNHVADVDRNIGGSTDPTFTFKATESKNRYELIVRESSSAYSGTYNTFTLTDYYRAHLWEYLFENIDKIKASAEQYFQTEKKKAEGHAGESAQREDQKLRDQNAKNEAEQKRLDNIFQQPTQDSKQ